MGEEKKTILIVDDDPDAIEFVKTVVLDVGDFSVITASDGASGKVKAIEEQPDLIVLDVMMPGQDGFYVFYDIRAASETRHIPVIMVTGVSKETGLKFSADDMGEFMGKAPEAFLDKPVDPAKLQETVKRVLQI